MEQKNEKLNLVCFILAFLVLSVSPRAFSQEEEEPGGEADVEEPAAEGSGEVGESADESDEEADAPAPTTAVSEEEVETGVKPESAEGGARATDYSIKNILKSLQLLKKSLEQSEKRMDDIVGIVLSSAETKGSRIALAYRNDMSPDFKLVQAVFSLDGAPIYKKSDDDGVMHEQEVEIYDGAILPGKHHLSVTLVFRGHGVGILSYLSKYRFKVRSTHSFAVKEGQGIYLKVIGFEKGDVNTKLEDRPAIKYAEKQISMD